MSKALIVLATAVALVAFGSVTVAHAHEVAPLGTYQVSVTTEAGQQRLATLTCKPAGGTHPYKRKACAQLVKAGGDIAAIPPKDGFCTMEYAPVTVRAEGAWNGTHQMFENVFSNRCVAILQTGGYVFNI